MDNQNGKSIKQNNEMLSERLQQLEDELKEKKIEHEQIEMELEKLKQEFNAVKRSKLWRVANPAMIKQTIRSVGAFLLGRRNPRQLYSKAYKRKQAANDLKTYKYHLYNLGFTEKALQDFEELLQNTMNPYLERATAWELALWYANFYTAEAASHALRYLRIAETGEKNLDQLRFISILKA